MVAIFFVLIGTCNICCVNHAQCYVPGGLGVSIEGPSKVEILPKDNKDGTVTISYTPTLPGEYKIVVKYAGQLIDGAPYFAKISAPCTFGPFISNM
jgi:Filamin/ABP280 repeat